MDIISKFYLFYKRAQGFDAAKVRRFPFLILHARVYRTFTSDCIELLKLRCYNKLQNF